MTTRAKDSARGDMTGSEARTHETMDGIEYSPEELSEFLSADLADVHADPHFKDQLRQRLWNLLKSRIRHRN